MQSSGVGDPHPDPKNPHHFVGSGSIILSTDPDPDPDSDMKLQYTVAHFPLPLIPSSLILNLSPLLVN